MILKIDTTHDSPHLLVHFFLLVISICAVLVSTYTEAHIYSSIAIVFIIAASALHYGLISIPTIILGACYIPSLAFLYSHLGGGTYVNMMNHELQDQHQLVAYCVSLSAVSAMIAYSIMSFERKSFRNVLSTTFSASISLSKPLYLLAILASAGFFWLTDPGATWLTHTYTEILPQRFKGTQFAGSLAMIAWLFAFCVYISSKHHASAYTAGSYRRLNRFFVLATIFSILWLALHARRSELLGIIIVLILYGVFLKGQKRVIIYGILAFMGLQLIGVLRGGIEPIIAGNLSFLMGHSLSNPNVISLPGGASNVFMSFVVSVDYFSTHEFYLGKTFVNYLLQLAPSNLYSIVGITKPLYFHQTGVFANYAWNGGVNTMSIFYGNFGSLGVVGYGFFVGMYANLMARAIKCINPALKVLGLFGVGMAPRIFWYEPINFLKPLWLLLIIFLIFETVRLTRRSKREVPSEDVQTFREHL